MSIVSNADVTAYVTACGAAVPAGLGTLVTLARAAAERGLRDFIGYSIEQAAVTEYLPHGAGNPRGDGDGSAAGFDLSASGMVVSRGVGRQGRRELVLGKLPVRSVASVYDNPAAYNTAGGDWPATSLLPAANYYLDTPGADSLCWSGILYRNVGSWATLARCVKVTYTAGLTAAELAEDGDYPNFRLAVLTAAALTLGKILARGRVALTGHVVSSVSIQDFSASFGGTGGTSLGTADGVGLAGVDFPTEARGWVKNYRHMAYLH
jgi:hypothetical protein